MPPDVEHTELGGNDPPQPSAILVALPVPSTRWDDPSPRRSPSSTGSPPTWKTSFGGLGSLTSGNTRPPKRDNIVARWDAPGRTAARRTLVFEAHQDTVPTDNMTIDPFAASVENGRLYGRGACDIKGGMAAMLAAFARLVREKPRGAASVIMACTVDEEHTSLGVHKLVAEGLKADMAVVAEPTQLQIVHAHKGAVRWQVHTTGRSCHSSAPEKGANAIYAMGRVLVAIERYAEWLRGSRIDPLLGPPTLSVGRIEGGTSRQHRSRQVPDRDRPQAHLGRAAAGRPRRPERLSPARAGRSGRPERRCAF